MATQARSASREMSKENRELSSCRSLQGFYGQIYVETLFLGWLEAGHVEKVFLDSTYKAKNAVFQ